MKTYLENFLKFRTLLIELVVRDIKIKYRKSFLGLLWTLLNPLFMMLVITIVFSNLFKSNIPNFPVYFLSGQVIFNFFSESTSMAMNSIIFNSALIKKVYIPKYLFPVSKICSCFVNLFFSLIALMIVIIATKAKVSGSILLFFIPLVYVFVFSVGIGLVLSTLAVFFRDLLHLYGIFLTALAYFTPVFYPETIIPLQYRFIVEWNPIYYYIDYFRQIVLYHNIPSISYNITCIGISLISLFLGLLIFKRKQDRFIAYV